MTSDASTPAATKTNARSTASVATTRVATARVRTARAAADGAATDRAAAEAAAGTTPAGHRSELDLTRARLHAIDAWHRARRRSEAAAESAELTREMRLDLNRRMQARRREQAAIVARADEQLRCSGDVLRAETEVRVVLAHRNAWLRDKIASRMAEQGLRIVGVFDDGADAAGTIVVEQPDLVLVEDRLPTLPGLDLVRRVRAYSSNTVIGVQVLDSTGISPFVDAGAQAVFTRRIPPADIADQLLGCLQEGRTLTLA